MKKLFLLALLIGLSACTESEITYNESMDTVLFITEQYERITENGVTTQTDLDGQTFKFSVYDKQVLFVNQETGTYDHYKIVRFYSDNEYKIVNEQTGFSETVLITNTTVEETFYEDGYKVVIVYSIN